MLDETEFQEWLEGLAVSEASSAIFSKTMGRILSKDDRVCPIVERPRMGKPIRRFVRPVGVEFEGRLRHVADWIEACVLAGETWTTELDADGLPTRMKTLGTFEQAEAKADKAMIRAVSRTGKLEATRAGEEIAFETGDGWTVVRMLTPESLDYETSHMQHCIGQGSYDAQLKKGRHRYYSLRDPYNKPHVTIEIDENIIRQIKGKQNRPPAERYLAKLREFLKGQDLYVDNDASLILGLIRDRDQKIHNLYELPAKLRVGGNLNLEGIKIPSLPDDLEVGGYLDVTNTDIERLPKRLVTGSHLIVGRGRSTRLPEDLTIGGNLALKGSSIEELPEGLVVPGALKLEGSRIERLPNGLKVGKDLVLPEHLVDRVPPDAVIGGKIVSILDRPVAYGGTLRDSKESAMLVDMPGQNRSLPRTGLAARIAGVFGAVRRSATGR